MSERSWTRRDFGRAVAPALLAAPALAAAAGAGGVPTRRPGPATGPVPLWAEARATIDFYRKHLPAGLSLSPPTLAAADPAQVARRSVTCRVMRGDAAIGQLDLDATFRPDRPAPLWQSTRVTGGWYGASVANAFEAGEFA